MGLTAAALAGWLVASGAHATVSARPSLLDPRVFRIPAKDFPWKTRELLNARVESNDRADGDALVIYNTTVFGDPDWNALGRLGGWYEDALMRNGPRNPAVNILVSEYASEDAAKRAFQSENHSESYRPPRSRPHLGSESVEYAGSALAMVLGSPARVEDSIIYTRDQNLELDVAVFDVHSIHHRWITRYRQAALALARHIVAIAHRILPPPTATPQPSAVVTPKPG